MATTVVNVEVQARLEDFRKQMERDIPNSSKKAKRELENLFVQSQKEAAAAAKAAAAVKTGIEGAAAEASKLAKIGGLVGGQLGSALQLVGDGSESLADGLTGAGKAALGVGVALAAAFATVSAINAMTAYVVEGVTAFEDLKSTMGATHPVVLANEAAINEAAVAMQAAEVASAALHVELSGALSPAVEEASYAWTGLYTVLGDAAAVIPTLNADLSDTEKTIIKMIPGVGGLYGMFDALATGGRAAAEALKLKIAQGKRDLELANEADDAVRQQLIALGMLEEADDRGAKASTARSQARVAGHDAAAEAAKREADAVWQAQIAAMEASVRRWETEKSAASQAAALLQSLTIAKGDFENQYYATVSANIAKYTDLAMQSGMDQLEIAANVHALTLAADAEFREIMAERDAADAARQQALRDQAVAAEESAAAARTAAYDKARNDVFSIAMNLNSAVMTLLDSEFESRTKYMNKESAEYKKKARKQFAIQKAWSISQAALNTAVGITQAISQNAGMPILMAISIAAAAAAGAAQIAVIAAQKPSFHSGGMVRQPDEVDARLQSGEAVMNRQAVRNMGGEDGIDRLNRGHSPMMGGQPSVVVMAIDGRIMDALWDGSPSGSGRSGLAARVDQRVRGGMSGQSGRWG